MAVETTTVSASSTCAVACPRWTVAPRAVRAAVVREDLASLPVNQEWELLRGRHGKAISELRPSGAAEFDGKRIDVLSEGPLIEAGTWVRCIDVKTGRVIVRAVDAPNLDKMDFDRLDT